MKVLFLTNVPSPYRVEFFNQLGEECELTVLYQKKRSAERNEKWVGHSRNTYKEIYLNGISTGVDQTVSFEVLKYLSKSQYNHIIICGLASPTEILALTWCKIMHIPFYFESDGGFAKKRKGVKEWIKRVNLSNARGYFSTGKNHDAYYLAYGVNGQQLIRYPFSSISNGDIIDSPISKDKKMALRKKKGYNYSKMAITVGQFIHRKGIDILIKAWKRMDMDSCLLIIGGEPTEEYRALLNENYNQNIDFIPFVEKQELEQYYKMCDFFVFPTREDIWGLVVNEAMAFGLPVISSDRAAAALEMIIDGDNGFLFESENVDSLEMKMKKIVAMTSEEWQYMGNNAIEKAREFTIEKMVQKHIEVLS